MLPTATPTITPTSTSASTPTSLPADAPQDLGPLIALYNSTNGHNWRDNDNWLSDRPLYEWFGLRINTDGRVIEIDLSDNGLVGSLPPELGDLAQLQQLYINSNSNLSGVIPREFGRLNQLQELILNGNDFTGPIPHEVGLLPDLSHLNLSNNRLSGEIPPSLIRSKTLSLIELADNELTGGIPSEFAERSRIQVLSLNGNQLNSEIPPEIGQAWDLSELWLHDNQLTGEIPPGIAQLEHLTGFTVFNNQLTGHIPRGFENLHSLQWLDLDNNQLTGTIPEELGELEELKRLSIAGNDFTGCIPSNLRGIEDRNIAFANIEVCGEPIRAETMIPPYIRIAIGDPASPAETHAVELAAQWINSLAEDIGWPIPVNTITVYVDYDEGLVMNYATHVRDCNLECARWTIDDRGSAAVRGAAFVPRYGTQGNALKVLAHNTARLVFSVMQIEIADGLRSQGYQPDPGWWTEGLANLLAELAIADGTGQPRDEQRRSIADYANRVFKPLWELESKSRRYLYRNPVGASAIDLLASQVGLRKLTEFYTERTDGEEWRQTFQRVFNINVHDFYELFNQHHRNGYPLRELSLDGSTQWP